MACHAKFDSLWKDGPFSRTDAYRLLAKEMKRSIQTTHIGMFDEAECEQALKAIEYLASLAE